MDFKCLFFAVCKLFSSIFHSPCKVVLYLDQQTVWSLSLAEVSSESVPKHFVKGRKNLVQNWSKRVRKPSMNMC